MNGLIVIDKPSDYTSRDIVNIVEKVLNTRKVGHAGTLDPLATGVLVIAVGTGLKILEFINDNDKEYIATVKMGISTNTLDITGEIIETKDNYCFDLAKIREVLNSFKGKYLQEVPLYSSVKVGGQRLYKYAREGKEVKLPKREVEIYDIELLNYNDDEFAFKVSVSKGTYIRSLIRDIGKKLEIPCTMKELRRTKQGVFKIEDAISLKKVETGNIELIPLSKALTDITLIDADSYLENRIKNGSILRNYYDKDIVGFKNQKGEVIAIYKPYDKDNTKIKPIKVLKEDE